MVQCNVAYVYNLSARDIYASNEHGCLFFVCNIEKAPQTKQIASDFWFTDSASWKFFFSS